MPSSTNTSTAIASIAIYASIHLSSTKINQNRLQNPPSWVPKSSKLESKIHQNRSLGASWRGLGAILAHLGHKIPQELKMLQSLKIGYALLGPKLDPILSHMGRFGGMLEQFWQHVGLQRAIKMTSIFWTVFESFFYQFWIDFGSILDPKLVQKSIQNRFQNQSKKSLI